MEERIPECSLEFISAKLPNGKGEALFKDLGCTIGDENLHPKKISPLSEACGAH